MDVGGGRKTRHVRHRPGGRTCGHEKGACEGKVVGSNHLIVTILSTIFPHFSNSFALSQNRSCRVPRATYNKYSDFGYGIHPLMLKVMAWCFPFMVHKDDLKEAIDSLLAATADDCYVNPTTGVEFHGWIPKSDSDPPFSPLHHKKDRLGPRSMNAVISILTDINKTGQGMGIQADLNPLAPLICDFVLNSGEVDEPIRVEHKLAAWGRTAFRTGRASPFSKNRLWHFLVIHSTDDDLEFPGYICIPRHTVDPSWAGLAILPEDVMSRFDRFIGPNGLSDLLEYIQRHAADAIRCADEVVAAATPGDMVDEELVSSNADTTLYRLAREEERAKILLAGRRQHSRGLPWLCPKLNDQAEQCGDHFVLPLDIGHGICNHVGVKFAWAKEDHDRYHSPDKRLPRHIFDRSMQNEEVTALRFADYSGGERDFGTLGWQVCPAVMRGAYWLKPVSEQQFMTVYSMLPPRSAQVYDAYGAMPSGHTTQFDTEERREKLEVPNDAKREEGQSREQAASDARCAMYFDQRPQREFVLREPKVLTGTHPTPSRLVKGSAFLQEKIDPLKNVVKLGDGSLCSLLRELIVGEDEEMAIKPSQDTQTNGVFDKSQYKIKTKDLLQAMWDYGLTRRARRATGAKGEGGHDLESESDSSDGEDVED